jgi:uncharacterized membrane protein SpoIIM required for sporulation
MIFLIIIIAIGVMLGIGGSRRLNVQHRDPRKQEAKEAFEHKARIFLLIVFGIAAVVYTSHLASP